MSARAPVSDAGSAREAVSARAHDLRLAVPVGLAWLALAACSSSAQALAAAPLVAAGAAAGLLAAAALLRARAPTAAVVVVLLAVGAGLAVPLLTGAQAAAERGLETCRELQLLALAEATPSEVVVTGCDGASVWQPAMLLRGGEAPLAIGAGASGRCDAWADGARWLVTCAELEVGEPAPWAGWATPLRDGLLAASARLPGDGGQLLPGLAIGDVRRVTPGLEAAMLDSGLTHLTAVSGANCVIVVGAAFQLAAALGARRPVRIGVALVALVGFAVLVTPEPSVVRAGTMASIALLGLATGRRAGALALLALAVLVVLLVQPHLATSAGFALSALATCGLVVHAPPIAHVLARVLPRPLALLIAVPAAAQLWCLPVLVMLDARVSLVALLANLLAGPAAPVATIAGLAVCLTAPLAHGVAVALAWIAWLPAAWIGAVARVSQAMPAAQAPWPELPWGAALAAVVVAVVVAGHVRGRMIAGIAAAAVVGAAAVAVAGWPALRLAALGDWRIAQCDVGQGSATVARAGGAVVLVDTGPDPAALSGCLGALGVARVDLLVLTHFDADHAGGSSAVAGRVGTLVHGPQDDRSAATVAALVASGAEAMQAARGDAWQVGDVRVEALWPAGALEPGNDASVAVAVDLPGDSLELLVLGDLGAGAQARLLRAGVPAASVVVVSHHGSSDQLATLYRRVGASVGLVGVGPNDYGHPTDAALRLVRESGGVPLRTDELGTIALERRGDAWLLWSERPQP